MLNSSTPSNHFHSGERTLQSETGKREEIAHLSQMMMRDYMTEQQFTFFQGLRYLFVGTVDEQGQPWASILSGPVGFISVPDPKFLQIDLTLSLVEPAFSGLQQGSPFGVLGLDFSNRRRNRVHGHIVHLEDNQLVVGISQSYGNCPKYISTRMIDDSQSPPIPGVVVEREHLSEEDIARITRADTFFIASHHQDGSGAAYEGADISHRGGSPGFVHVESDRTLTIPDYMGNFLFNTLGNLLVNSLAGLLFIDFNTGDLIQMTGKADIIRAPPDIQLYPGAQRLLHIHIDRVRYTPQGLPLHWQFLEPSPFNPSV